MAPPPAFEWTINEYSIWLAEIHFGDKLVSQALAKRIIQNPSA